MDLTLFDFRRLLTPQVIIEPTEVELSQDWHDFEKTLVKFKNEYYKNKSELNKLTGIISRHKDELNVIKYAINNVQTNDTAQLLNEVYNKKASQSDIDELTEEAAIIAGECKAMKKILQDTNAEQFNKFTCSICTDNLVDTFVDPCGHVFCERCISRTVNKTHCPGCRTAINAIKRIYSL
jgi:Zinc finger, C3HC4 type (RING finger)